MKRISYPPLPAVLLLLALLLATSACGASPGGGVGQGEQPAEDPDASGSTGELGHPTLGAADAPVVMVEWGDFQ